MLLFLSPSPGPSLFLSLDKLRCLEEDEDPEVIPENTDLVTLWYDFVLSYAICFGAGVKHDLLVYPVSLSAIYLNVFGISFFGKCSVLHIPIT